MKSKEAKAIDEYMELIRLGLKIPKNEREEIIKAVKFIDQMTALVKKLRSARTEPAHIVSFPRINT